jgi:hypothetical protein
VSDQPPPGSVPPGSPAPGSVPPGWQPPPPPPGYPPPPYGAPYQFAPVYQPGIVALRPLSLGDFFDGAFKLIRRNPKPMVGLAAMVTTAFLAVPALITVAVAATGNLSFGGTGHGRLDATEAATLISTYSGSALGALATVILNGMIVHVVAEAVLGRKATIAEAWAAARGRLLRLLGLTLLNGLMVVVVLGVPVGLGILAGFQIGVAAGVGLGGLGVVLALVLLAFLQVRFFQLAAPALVLERLGVFASMRRAHALSHRQFWRLFGIYLLTSLVVGLVGGILGIPFSIAGAIGPIVFPHGAVGPLLVVFASYLSQIVVGSVTTPFTSAVVALQYVDQRIRKEGFDVELIASSQQTTPTLR